MDERKLFIKVECQSKTNKGDISLINLSELINACDMMGAFDLSNILKKYTIDRDTIKKTVSLHDKTIAAE